MKMIQLEVWQGAKILGSRTSCLRILKVSHESQRCFRFVIFKTSPTNMVATNDNNSIKLHISQYHSLWLSAFTILIRVDATMLWSRLLTRLKQKNKQILRWSRWILASVSAFVFFSASAAKAFAASCGKSEEKAKKSFLQKRKRTKSIHTIRRELT